MKIKKNGITLNLTESDIKKLRKTLLKEQPDDWVISPEDQLRSLQEQVNNNTELIKNLYGWMYTDANRK